MAGISRSVTLVIAYLIKNRGMDYQSAFSLVKARRKIVHFQSKADSSERWFYPTIEDL